MPKTQPIRKKPCNECPFRRKSIPGYVGDTTPTQFLDTVLDDHAMPCHKTIDYNDPEWKEKWVVHEHNMSPKAKHCAGAAIFFANMGKLSRDRNRPRLNMDGDTCFITPTEFADHHGAELPFPYVRTAPIKILSEDGKDA